MRAKHVVSSLLVVVVLFTLSTNQSIADSKNPTLTQIPCPKHSPFVCNSQMQTIINAALKPLNDSIATLETTVTNIQGSLAQINSDITGVQNNQKNDEDTIKAQADEIKQLQNQVASLSTKTPLEIVLFNLPNNVNIGQESPIMDTTGYRQMVFDYENPSGPQGGFTIKYSTDKNSWSDQSQFTVTQNPLQYVIPIKAQYYKIVFTGGGGPFSPYIKATLY